MYMLWPVPALYEGYIELFLRATELPNDTPLSTPQCLPLTPIPLGTGRSHVTYSGRREYARGKWEKRAPACLSLPACMHVFLPIHPPTHDHHDVAFVDSLFDPAFRSNARKATK
jgi:hypothetical protein